jgi:archaellum biogenesis ATPase FlaH
MASLRAVADVSIQLDARQMASSLKRRMTIARFLRPGGRYTNMIGFRVEPGIGFVIEISMVA